MTPLSYQGFGFTAILVMVAILSAGQLIKYLKERFLDHHNDETHNA
ncbi:MAG TPA: hypothetical protein VGZ90_17070 [Puia sp.]|jgi:hypothetical protein|nr:hypothetical protein [Puia sp.]